MRIELPFPDMKRLNAHAKGNWRNKAGPTKSARQLAMFTCIDMRNRGEVHPISGKVLVSYAFFVPDNRPRDEANMIQACKPYIDGIVQSKLIEGDDWKRMGIYNVTTQLDRKNPRVEITLNATNGNGDFLAN